MPTQGLTLPAIDPVLIEIGPFALRWYALAYIVGIFLGWWYAKRLVANQRLWGPAGSPMKPTDIDDFVIWATLGIIVGGRLGYVLFYDLPRFIDHPMEVFALWQGGMSFHGGFLGTVLAMVIFARVRGIPVWSLIDVIAPSVTFGLLLGRLANFVNGELFGRVTDVPWAFVFPLGGPLPRHPSQLYEAALEGVVLFILLRFLTHGGSKLRSPGFVSGAFAAGYGVFRTFVEFFREPDVQIGYLAGGLTMGMLLSIPMIIAGVWLMVRASRRTTAAEGAAAE
ncbi:prolipoprotein diacylglyceryl transferase [Bauldia sp.]|uniref:prolipoprotein diacylglyceryl transferase n=1 Tax=Bauldia sp. TaxID=2575872 RepID=UPI003BAD7CD1